MKRRLAAILTLLPVLAVMVFIFVMSAETAEESSEISGGITETVLRVLMPSYEELSPGEQAAVLDTAHDIVRKAAHFLEYAALGFFWMIHLQTVQCCIGRRLRWRHLICTVGGVLYAVSDECHQAFVPGRGPMVQDVLLDVAGVLFGMGVVIFAVYIATFISKKHFA